MKPTPIEYEILEGTVTLSGFCYKPGMKVKTIYRLDQRPGLKVRIAGEKTPDVCEATPVAESTPTDTKASNLVAVHKGGGRWAVVDAVTDEKIHNGWYTRKEAEAIANG